MIIIDEILVSSDIVQKQFVCHLEKCKGACCWEGDYGAPLESEEMEIIKHIFEDVKNYLPEENQKRIEQIGLFQYFEEPDMIGTALMPDGSCVFLSKNENGIAKCGIEQANEDGKVDFKKPISCHLYPIRISKNEKTGFEALNYDEWDICSAACALGKKLELPMYQFLKNAIIRKYGEEFYSQLDHAAKHIYSK